MLVQCMFRLIVCLDSGVIENFFYDTIAFREFSASICFSLGVISGVMVTVLLFPRLKSFYSS